MGTRHLIAVHIDGNYKIAQYGQWYGYPGGQGVHVLNFLRWANLDEFKDRCRALSFYTDKEIEALNTRIKKNKIDWVNEMPWLSRDSGSRVLEFVANGRCTKLCDSRDFVYDPDFCEWAYVVDFDTGTFEVLSGHRSWRFAGAGPDRFPPKDNNPGGVCGFVAKWPLSDLPTNEAFLNTFGEEE